MTATNQNPTIAKQRRDGSWVLEGLRSNLHTGTMTYDDRRGTVVEVEVTHIRPIKSHPRAPKAWAILTPASEALVSYKRTIAKATPKAQPTTETAPAPAPRTARTVELATDRQVEFILDLVAARYRDGTTTGFMSGPTTRTEIAAMTRREASTYIDSLTERY